MVRRDAFRPKSYGILGDLGFGILTVVSLIAVLALLAAAVPFVISSFSKEKELRELEEEKATQALLTATRIQGLNRHHEASLKKYRERTAFEKQSLENKNQELQAALDEATQKAQEVVVQKTTLEEQTQNMLTQNEKLKEKLDLLVNQKFILALPYESEKGLELASEAVKQKIVAHVKMLEKKGMKQFRIYSYTNAADDAEARSSALRQAIDVRQFLVEQGVSENFIEMRIVANKPAYDLGDKLVNRIDIRGFN